MPCRRLFWKQWQHADKRDAAVSWQVAMSPREKVRFHGKSNARCFGAWCNETGMVIPSSKGLTKSLAHWRYKALTNWLCQRSGWVQTPPSPVFPALHLHSLAVRLPWIVWSVDLGPVCSRSRCQSVSSPQRAHAIRLGAPDGICVQIMNFGNICCTPHSFMCSRAQAIQLHPIPKHLSSKALCNRPI